MKDALTGPATVERSEGNGRAIRRESADDACSDALAGSMLPFILRSCGLDPASASAPFVATLVDVTGLIIYFSVASIILRGILL